MSADQIQPEYGDEQADAGRDGWTRLARPNSQARAGTGAMFIFPVQLTTSRIGNFTRLIQTLLYVMTIHTYIHTRRIRTAMWLVNDHENSTTVAKEGDNDPT